MKPESSKKPVHSKKEIKGAVINDMETALPQLRESMGEKKFHKRMKKAAAVLTKGLSRKELLNEKPKDKKKEENWPAKEPVK